MRCEGCGRFRASADMDLAPARFQPGQWAVINGADRIYWCSKCREGAEQ